VPILAGERALMVVSSKMYAAEAFGKLLNAVMLPTRRPVDVSRARPRILSFILRNERSAEQS
jgi:hypothetical protein